MKAVLKICCDFGEGAQGIGPGLDRANIIVLLSWSFPCYLMNALVSGLKRCSQKLLLESVILVSIVYPAGCQLNYYYYYYFLCVRTSSLKGLEGPERQNIGACFSFNGIKN